MRDVSREANGDHRLCLRTRSWLAPAAMLSQAVTDDHCRSGEAVETPFPALQHSQYGARLSGL